MTNALDQLTTAAEGGMTLFGICAGITLAAVTLGIGIKIIRSIRGR